MGSRARCPEEGARYRTDTITGRTRVLCVCGWVSKFYESEGEAIDVWGFHRGRRSTDREVDVESAEIDVLSA